MEKVSFLYSLDCFFIFYLFATFLLCGLLLFSPTQSRFVLTQKGKKVDNLPIFFPIDLNWYIDETDEIN